MSAKRQLLQQAARIKLLEDTLRDTAATLAKLHKEHAELRRLNQYQDELLCSIVIAIDEAGYELVYSPTEGKDDAK